MKKPKLNLVSLLVILFITFFTGVSIKDLTLGEIEKGEFFDQILGAITDSNLPEDYYLVTKVVDGDTIKVSNNGEDETVRLVGIDTPETKDPRKPVQCFGQEASDYLTGLVLGQPVKLESDSQNTKDRYGRRLSYVYLEDGIFVNAKMVKEGYALAYTSIDSDQLDYFLDLEQEARDQQLGLWSSCDYEPS